MKLVRLGLLTVLAAVLLLPVVVEAERDVISVRVILPDNQHTVATTAHTVDEFLDEQGLDPSDFTRVFPAPETTISRGTHIFLYPEKSDDKKVKSIDYSTRSINTDALPSSHSFLIRGGQPGKKIGGRVVDEPAPAIKLNGQADFKVEQLQKLRRRASKRMLATGYSTHALDTAPYNDGYTALGLSAGYGIVAVDPRVIPLGTLLYVEGYGYALAADVGGAIKGNRIDLCFSNRRQALLFGRQYKTVYILG
ncbi:MAG: 3D domain-containing protein [bacterium]